MSDVKSWDSTAANNNAEVPDGFKENMAPSGVNDSAREVMAAIKRWYEDISAKNTSAGSSNAYTLAASQTVTGYTDTAFVFIANHANSGTSTLNVDSVGAKTIKRNNDQDLSSGDIESGQICHVAFDATNDYWQLLSPNAATKQEDVITTEGDLVVGDSSGEAARLGKGSANTFLMMPPTGQTQSPSYFQIMTTQGDLITKSDAGTATPLAAGATGTVLTSNGAGEVPSYQIAGAIEIVASGSVAGTSDFAVTGLTSDYYKYQIIIEGLYFNTANRTLHARMSVDGGVSYDSSTAYAWVGTIRNPSINSTSTDIVGGGNSKSEIEIFYDSGNAGAGDTVERSMTLEISLINPAATAPTHLFAQGSCFNSNGGMNGISLNGSHKAATSVDAIQFLGGTDLGPSGATITAATYIVYGYKAS